MGSAHSTTGLAAWVAALAVPPAVSVSGPTPDHPERPLRAQRALSTFVISLSVAGEENVTMAEDRHYPSENILIHEFSHSCMEVAARRPLPACQCGRGLIAVDPAHGSGASNCQLLRAVADVLQIGMEEQQRQSVAAAYEGAKQSGVSSATGLTVPQRWPSWLQSIKVVERGGAVSAVVHALETVLQHTAACPTTFGTWSDLLKTLLGTWVISDAFDCADL